MDVQAMQSMDWLFKKERIYLLAQFWQQVNTKTEDNETNIFLTLSARHIVITIEG